MQRSCSVRADGSIDYACGPPSKGGHVRRTALACTEAAAVLTARLKELQSRATTEPSPELTYQIQQLLQLTEIYTECNLERIVQEHIYLRQQLLPSLNSAISLVEQRLATPAQFASHSQRPTEFVSQGQRPAEFASQGQRPAEFVSQGQRPSNSIESLLTPSQSETLIESKELDLQ